MGTCETQVRAKMAKDARNKIEAWGGTKYLFRHDKGKWVKGGMVDDDERSLWAYAHMCQWGNSGAPADAVAFVPFCWTDENLMSDDDIKTFNVQIILRREIECRKNGILHDGVQPRFRFGGKLTLGTTPLESC